MKFFGFNINHIMYTLVEMEKERRATMIDRQVKDEDRKIGRERGKDRKKKKGGCGSEEKVALNGHYLNQSR